jgi:hypothetical protein
VPSDRRMQADRDLTPYEKTGRATPSLTVIVTGHHEGALCRPAFAALARAVEAAVSGGTAVEVLGILDRPDVATRWVGGRAAYWRPLDTGVGGLGVCSVRRGVGRCDTRRSDDVALDVGG